MCNIKSTILLGAGAAIEIGGKKTEVITNGIIQPKRYKNYSTKDIYGKFPYFTVVSKVYDRLKEKYPNEPNFEQIFHVLEMLESYNRVWSNERVNSRMFPPFAPFVVPETNIVSHLEWGNLSSLISQCQVDIMKMINEYDAEYKIKKDSVYKWYKDFWNKFSGFDLFNLNYDTTIEESLPCYCDGFVDSDDSRFQKFNPRVLCDEKSKYKICHMHGCILYCRQSYKDINHEIYEYHYSDMYKWKDYSLVEKMLQNSSGSNSSCQSGETLQIGSIITGLRKTDKVTVFPYNYYHYYLNTAILNNKSLLVVGYSFGDFYINDLIERVNVLYGKNKRIVVVTYWSHKDSFAEKDWDSENLNENELLFLKRMMHDDSFQYRWLDETIRNEDAYISKDGDVMLFVYGFESAVRKHGEQIVKFLES